MIKKSFSLFRFNYLPEGQKNYQTVYIIADDWEMAFRLMYVTYGDNIVINTGERLATEGIDLLIDEIDYIESHKSYNSIVIDDISRY